MGKSNTRQEDFENAHENPAAMSVPLVILGLGAIFVGYIFRDAFIGLGTDFFGHSIYSVSYGEFGAIFVDDFF